MIRSFFILVWPLFALGANPVEEAAKSPEWRRILHYKQHYITGYRSAADGPGFFLAPGGERDPEAELKATLRALKEGGGIYGKLGQSVHCAFPLRKQFLERELGEKFPGGPCPELEEFLKKLGAEGVSLVFATAYAGNPASMFGHSFLKIRGKNAGAAGGDLLDWSVNYSARVPHDENSFAFAYHGLAGGYDGQFTLVPYYAKIEEYGFLEGRDLWEYELNFSSAEIERLLLAVWELETNSHFRYFFFDENCSFQLLALLEIVKPDWDLKNYFLHLIPGESIKRLNAIPGAVRKVHFRPSLERRLFARVEALSRADLASFHLAQSEGPRDLGGPALEAYLLYLQAEKKRRGEEWDEKAESRFRQALVARARDPNRSAAPVNTGGEETRPELSHGPYRLGLGAVADKSGDWQGGVELSVVLAYHDLLDRDAGLGPHSEVHFPNFRFRYSGRHRRVRLEEAELLSIVSLIPRTLVRWPWAWRARVGYRPLLDRPDSRGLHGEIGGGKALSLYRDRWTIWLLAGAGGDVAEDLNPAARFEPWVELGSLLSLTGETKLLSQLRWVQATGGAGVSRAEWEGGVQRSFGREWALRAEGKFAFVPQAHSRVDAVFSALRYF